MRLTCLASLVLPLLAALQQSQAVSIKSLQTIDNTSAQAAFALPCSDCSPSFIDESFLLNFEAFPSETPCGSSNLTLNGAPLTSTWETNGGLQSHGQAYILASGRNLSTNWFLDCLSALPRPSLYASDDAQLLTVTVDKVDGRRPNSILGFTLSFKTHPPLDLLRLSLEPVYPFVPSAESEDWRDPSPKLRLHPERLTQSDPKSQTFNSVQQDIKDLEILEAELKTLTQNIAAKKASIAKGLEDKSSRSKVSEEERGCNTEGFCLVPIVQKLRSVAKVIYITAFRHDSDGNPSNTHSRHWNTAGGQSIVKMACAENLTCKPGNSTVEYPAQAHYKDGQAGMNGRVFQNSTLDSYSTEKPTSRASLLSIIGNLLLTITGLAFLLRCCRRRRMSLRRRVDRAALREERRTARAYRRSARRQAIHDWWHGRQQSTLLPVAHAPDEKRALINQQESVLEEAMQDEIRQLRIEEEIRQMRNTHNVLDEMIRAEEGRSPHFAAERQRTRLEDPSAPAPPYSQFHHHHHPHGFIPISIPPVASTSYPSTLTPSSTGSTITGRPYNPCQHENIQPPNSPPFSPISRTPSLPDYRSDAGFSEPPSYHTNEDTDRELYTDTEDSESLYTGEAPSSPRLEANWSNGSSCQWTPASSIPNVSPRPSIASERTFL